MRQSFNSNIWKAYVFRFLTSLQFIGGVLIPFFTDWGQISFFQITILQSWFVLWVFLLELPTGAVADFFGRKMSLIISTLVYIAGILIYTSSPNFSIFLLGEFTLAIGAALYSGAYEALVYDSLKETGRENQSKKVFGRFESFHMAGLMIAGPVGSIVGARFGLQYAFLFMIIPFILAFLIALTFKEPKTKRKVESLRYLQTLTNGVKYFYSHKALRILALDGVVIASLAFLLIWLYQVLLKQLNVSLVYFGVVSTLITGAQLIAMNNFARLEKLFRLKSRYLFFSTFISGIAFIYLGINNDVFPAIVAMLIIAGFGLSRFVLISSYMQKHIESHNRATVASAASMLKRFSLAIIYPIIGLSVEWSLNYTLVIIGIIIVGFSLISKIQESYLID